MLYVTFNTKGGGGKSTNAQQILATHNLAKFGKSKIHELDDENLDSAYLDRSAVEAEQIELGNIPDEFAGAVAAAFPYGAENLVVDVGGNRTTTIVIKELSRLTARAMMVDAIVIPISDNRMSVINAEKTLNAIKASSHGEELIKKTIISLNRVRATKAQDIDNAAIQWRFRNAINLIKDWDLPYFFVYDMDGIENLAPLGLTIYEIAQEREELISHLVKRVKEAFKEGDQDKVMALDDLQWGVNVAADDFWPLIKRSHEMLDKALEKVKERCADEEVEEA